MDTMTAFTNVFANWSGSLSFDFVLCRDRLVTLSADGDTKADADWFAAAARTSDRMAENFMSLDFWELYYVMGGCVFLLWEKKIIICLEHVSSS